MNRYRIMLMALVFALIAAPAGAQTKEKITVAFPPVDPTARGDLRLRPWILR